MFKFQLNIKKYEEKRKLFDNFKKFKTLYENNFFYFTYLKLVD